MRIILSRKGWDGRFGGKASPVFLNGTIQSLPIDCWPTSPLYANICPRSVVAQGFRNLGAFIRAYHTGWGSSHPDAHLDPDLESGAYARSTGWLPCFGQQSGAATHLDNNYVGVGDLFLFYGWFDDVLTTGVRPVSRGHDRYVIWGWLQIGSIAVPPHIPAWLNYHPHVANASHFSRNNRIYVSSPTLTRVNTSAKWAGGGTFTNEHPNRNLTAVLGKRGTYPTRLPRWFSASMTHHRQEHVVDTAGIPQAHAWVSSIFV